MWVHQHRRLSLENGSVDIFLFIDNFVNALKILNTVGIEQSSIRWMLGLLPPLLQLLSSDICCIRSQQKIIIKEITKNIKRGKKPRNWCVFLQNLFLATFILSCVHFSLSRSIFSVVDRRIFHICVVELKIHISSFHHMVNNFKKESMGLVWFWHIQNVPVWTNK